MKKTKHKIVSGYAYNKEKRTCLLEVFVEFEPIHEEYRLISKVTKDNTSPKTSDKIHDFSLRSMLKSAGSKLGNSDSVFDNSIVSKVPCDGKEITLISYKDLPKNGTEVFATFSNLNIREHSVLMKFDMTFADFNLNPDELGFQLTLEGLQHFYYNTLNKSYYPIDELDSSMHVTEVFEEVLKDLDMNLPMFLQKVIEDMQLILVTQTPPTK